MFGRNGNDKAKGWYEKRKTYIKVGIDYIDTSDDFVLLINFLREVSDKKNIFIDTTGLYGFDQSIFLHLIRKTGKHGRYKAHLSRIDNQSVDEQVFENRCVSFDIYQPDSIVQWCDYANKKETKTCREEIKEIRENQLYVNVTFTEETVVYITGRPESEEIRLLIENFNRRGYKIKNIYGDFWSKLVTK